MSTTTAPDGNPLDYIPAGKPPPGVTSNLIDPPSRAHGIIVLDSIFVPLMLIAVFVRFFVRIKWTKARGWDDICIVLAAIGSVTHFVIHAQLIRHGLGRHMWDIPVSWLISTSSIRLLSSNGIVSAFTYLFTKLSILLLYLTLFQVSRVTKISIYVGSALVTGYYVSILFAGVAAVCSCATITATKDSTFCNAWAGPVTIITASFNTITDWWILILPLPLVLKLKMRLRQRLIVGGVFAAGLAACAASTARLGVQAYQYSGDSDTLWWQGLNAEFAAVEINIGIIVACVPTFPQMWRNTKPLVYAMGSNLSRSLLRRSPAGSKAATSSVRSEIGFGGNTKLRKVPSSVTDGQWEGAGFGNSVNKQPVLQDHGLIDVIELHTRGGNSAV
ncbi:hypothetical protein QBC40DRAFT_283031 [Triangularia verruculosa]|uniref:Rhodopsin domain-containing protein n=1 Tax=Triangularia verruculosa TaxID=2587418 RepID=A0AAN7ARY6_9PEZI|nr:hypothetical protein QBC40DRAFT_283031 [Triangularia verruculosa]